MDKTVKVVKTIIPTAFVTITRKTTYYSFPVRIEGGVYINDRSLAENNYVLDEITDLLINKSELSNIFRYLFRLNNVGMTSTTTY